MKRTVVTLCGSTRFKSDFEAAARDETLAGKVVLSVGLFGHQDGIDMTGQVKKDLDTLHLDKIDMSDEILVLNTPCYYCRACKEFVRQHGGSPVTVPKVIRYDCHKCFGTTAPKGYVGDSTAREIEYAKKTGKAVRYLYPE